MPDDSPSPAPLRIGGSFPKPASPDPASPGRASTESEGSESPPRSKTESAPDQKPVASDEKERDAAALCDEDHADYQGVVRDDVQAGIAAFGVSGVVVSSEKAVFTGPVIGGNATFSADFAARAVLRKIPPTTIRETDRSFADPKGITELRGALVGRRLILIRARRRLGGTTLGIRLLSGLAGDENVYELLTDAPLGELKADVIAFTTGGLLVDGLTPMQAAQLRTKDIHHLVDIMPGAESWVVIVVDDKAKISDPAIERMVLDAGQPPAARDVVFRHLSSALSGQSDNEIAEILDIPAIAELLLNVTPETYDIQQLAQLAGDVVELHRGTISLDEVLTRYELRSGHEIGEWFRKLTEPQLATAVSVAALHGMPYEAISTAARRLEDALVDKYGDRIGKRGRETRSDRLNAARTALTTTLHRTPYGSVQTQVATFLDTTLPVRVLDHVWHEYDSDRDLLLAWLRLTATDPSPSVRMRAATALGCLACHDFDKIRREVVVPWATSGVEDERERAVAALAVPARHPRTRGLVFNLVAHWGAQSAGRPRVAAARALGTAVGAVIPGGPDEKLADLAKDAGPVLAIAIGDSIAELMVNADAERVAQLLAMLNAWSGEALKDRQQAGAVGFLEVALTLQRSMPQVDGDGDDETVWWPSLLYWADPAYGTPELHELIVTLWSRVLVTPGVHTPASRVMRRWAGAAEGDPALRASFASLFVDVANSGRRQASVVRYHAKSWRGDDGDAPDTGSRLLNLLS